MLWKRIVRSLRTKGVAWSADRMLSIVQERLFDLRYGTDTAAFAELGSLTIESGCAADGCGYQPTRLRLARRVLSSLNVAPRGAFVDFGCGKGRVLLLAAEFGFRRITGVEFAKELCDIAADNIARYQEKTGSRTDIRIVEADAAEYVVKNDENVFFMFNPFSPALVEKVVGNIARSLKNGRRDGVIIYNNPLWSDVIEQLGFVPVRDFNGGECVVYRYAERMGLGQRRVA
jgi:SAM-dependent methyltransferase